MTYEYAVYFRLLLLSGYDGELQEYIDTALENQDPVSDIVLSLSTVGADNKKLLCVLNEYIRKTDESEIDYDTTVFGLILSFLRKKRSELSDKELTSLMYCFACNSGREHNDPWHIMLTFGVLYEDAVLGYVDKNNYLHELDLFLNDGVCLCDYPLKTCKEPFFKRVLSRFKCKH